MAALNEVAKEFSGRDPGRDRVGDYMENRAQLERVRCMA